MCAEVRAAEARWIQSELAHTHCPAPAPHVREHWGGTSVDRRVHPAVRSASAVASALSHFVAGISG